jgi:hypothetical protein
MWGALLYRLVLLRRELCNNAPRTRKGATMTNETTDNSEPETYLEIEAERVLGAAGYVNDGTGTWKRPEGNDQARNVGAWYRTE